MRDMYQFLYADEFDEPKQTGTSSSEITNLNRNPDKKKPTPTESDKKKPTSAASESEKPPHKKRKFNRELDKERKNINLNASKSNNGNNSPGKTFDELIKAIQEDPASVKLKPLEPNYTEGSKKAQEGAIKKYREICKVKGWNSEEVWTPKKIELETRTDRMNQNSYLV